MSPPDPEHVSPSDSGAKGDGGDLAAEPAQQVQGDQAGTNAESERIEKVLVTWLYRALTFVFVAVVLLYLILKDPRADGTLAKSATEGHLGAQLRLATNYLEGIDGRPDYAKAAEWMKKAAQSGSVIAETNVGIMYETGTGVQKDDVKAAEWFQSAARRGNAEAQVHLGTMYLEGRGVPKDEAKAVEWYRKAAIKGENGDEGDIAAMLNLGTMYLEGRGVPKDAARAMEWYRNAFDGHDPYSVVSLELGAISHRPAVRRYQLLNPKAKAAINIATMYEQGRDIPKDDLLAYHWFLRAAVRGSKEAEAKRDEFRKRLTKEQMDLETKMTYEEIEQIRRKYRRQ
jgi:TPR repeat protein